MADNLFFAYSPLINSKSSHISYQQIFYALINECPIIYFEKLSLIEVFIF